jgi:hypothetical protein
MAEELLFNCEQCRRPTRAHRKQRASFFCRILAFLLFLGGLILLLASPTKPPLAVPAVLLFALASWLFLRREEIWQCGECGAIQSRSEPLQDVQCSTLHLS